MASEDKGIEITIVILAALAIVGLGGLYGYGRFEAKREESRIISIISNLRQIASAGQQYILEEDIAAVSYNQIVGEYFPPLQSIEDETYDTLVVSKDGGVLTAKTSSGLEVTFTY